MIEKIHFNHKTLKFISKDVKFDILFYLSQSSECVHRRLHFIESTYTRFRFSKISFTFRYLRKKFLFNRVEICLYVSSSSLMLTYVIVIRSVRYQSTFAFNLLCIIDNQCSNFALFSINIVESKMTTDCFVFSK